MFCVIICQRILVRGYFLSIFSLLSYALFDLRAKQDIKNPDSFLHFILIERHQDADSFNSAP